MNFSSLDCTILCSSGSAHLNQVFTGFGALSQRGWVRLRIQKEPEFAPGVWAPPFLKVIVNGREKVFYDLLDADHFSDEGLAWCDFYFKRSYNPEKITGQPWAHKVYPYGLFYRVFGPHDFAMRRAFWSLISIRSRKQIRNVYDQVIESSTLLSRIRSANLGRVFATQEQFEAFPTRQEPPRILFLTRMWKPERAPNRSLLEERETINHMRAECIRRLRKEFGSQFTGGVKLSEYARKHFPDVVIEDPKINRRDNYLRLMRGSSICLTGMGLQGSNGGKLAEYTAGARAIVTEKLRYAVPGNFRQETNYLEFTSVDTCVQAVQRLVADGDFRYQMMQNNYNYYHNSLRPDKLIWNTLEIATSGTTG
jgi:hypothetical protein